MKQHHVAEHLEKGKEIGKEYTAKSWNFMKGMYANVAGQVETVARDNGYKVDLGERAQVPLLSLHVVLYVNSTTGVKDAHRIRPANVQRRRPQSYRWTQVQNCIVQSRRHHTCTISLQTVACSPFSNCSSCKQG